MRARALIALTCLLMTAHAVWACPAEFISELNAGRVPSAPPVVDNCTTDYAADLAAALAAFTTTHSPEQVMAVVALVRYAHKAAERPRPYSRIAEQLHITLPSFAPTVSSDPFEALDALPSLGVKPAIIQQQPHVDRQKEQKKIQTEPVSNSRPIPARPRMNWRIFGGVLFAGSLLAVGAIAYLLLRPKPEKAGPPLKFDDTEIGLKLKNVNNGLTQLTEKTNRLSEEVSQKLANTLTPEDLDARLAALHDEVGRLARLVEDHLTTPTEVPPEAPAAPPPVLADQVALEHQVLSETWKRFRANKELSALLDNALRDSTWQPIVDDLGKVVPDDLKPTFEGVVAPCREHSALVRKLSIVPKIINGELERLEVPKEVHRAREYTSLLTNAQSSTEVATRLNFRFKSWVTDTFLPFADLYLQRYQQSQLEKRQNDLQNGTNLVRQLLRIASVEPIEITPGETPFDSSRHIGRSTTNDPRFSDGVITGVVRNGFIERGQQVLRQPEVIVNRR